MYILVDAFKSYFDINNTFENNIATKIACTHNSQQREIIINNYVEKTIMDMLDIPARRDEILSYRYTIIKCILFINMFVLFILAHNIKNPFVIS